MGLETGTYLDDLNSAWPLGTDQKSAGDDHIRGIKEVLQASLPGLDGPILGKGWFIKPDGTVPMTGPLNMAAELINDVADPVDDQDAATKAYVLANGFASTLQAGDELLIRLNDHTLIPTGFTIGTVDNKALKFAGNRAAAADGGSNTFSAALNGNVTSSTVGNHGHGDTFSVTLNTANAAPSGLGVNVPVTATLNGAVTAGGSHNHSTNVNVQYREFHTIIKT